MAQKKLVSLLEKKIYDKFSSKKKDQPPQPQPSETKGEEIMAILKQENTPKVDKYQHVKDVYNDLKKHNQNIIKRHEWKF